RGNYARDQEVILLDDGADDARKRHLVDLRSAWAQVFTIVIHVVTSSFACQAAACDSFLRQLISPPARITSICNAVRPWRARTGPRQSKVMSSPLLSARRRLSTRRTSSFCRRS